MKKLLVTGLLGLVTLHGAARTTQAQAPAKPSQPATTPAGKAPADAGAARPLTSESSLVDKAPAGAGAAQQPGMRPGRTAPAAAPTHYADSAKFEAQWKEFYPLIKPALGVMERTQQSFRQMSRSFTARGVDSAAAWDSVQKHVDPNMDQKLLHDAYRAEFSAEELKAVLQFYKTPAGKHYSEVAPKLLSAGNQVGSYVQRTLSSTIQPMMKPLPVDPNAPQRPGRPGGPRPMPNRPAGANPPQPQAPAQEAPKTDANKQDAPKP